MSAHLSNPEMFVISCQWRDEIFIIGMTQENLSI